MGTKTCLVVVLGSLVNIRLRVKNIIMLVNAGRAEIGSVVSLILVDGVFIGLDQARLVRPIFGSQTWPPRSSRFRPNQSDKFNQSLLVVNRLCMYIVLTN